MGKMGYAAAATGDDGDPQQAAEIHSQATEDIMSEVNSSSVGSVQTAAASDNGGPAAAPTPEPDTGPPAGATKNVSFNLLPLSSSRHTNDCFGDSDSEEDEDGSGDVTSSVRVAVRIRPFLPSETGTSGVIDVLPANNAAGGHKRRRQQEDQPAAAVPTSLQIGGPAGVQFTYDAVHGTKSTQADLYLTSVRPLVRQCLKGCEFQVSCRLRL